jgi:cell division protein FtsB
MSVETVYIAVVGSILLALAIFYAYNAGRLKELKMVRNKRIKQLEHELRVEKYLADSLTTENLDLREQIRDLEEELAGVQEDRVGPGASRLSPECKSCRSLLDKYDVQERKED